MSITEKASYLKGLMEGMKFNTETDEGKLIKAIVDLLDDMALTVSDLENENATLKDYIEEVDADLAEVEQDVYQDGCEDGCDCDDDWFDEDEEDCCDGECGCGCGQPDAQ